MVTCGLAVFGGLMVTFLIICGLMVIWRLMVVHGLIATYPLMVTHLSMVTHRFVVTCGSRVTHGLMIMHDPISWNCLWQLVKFIWHKMSATQPVTEQRPSTAQDSLSKWVVFRFEITKSHNLSLSVTDRLTFVDRLADRGVNGKMWADGNMCVNGNT